MSIICRIVSAIFHLGISTQRVTHSFRLRYINTYIHTRSLHSGVNIMNNYSESICVATHICRTVIYYNRGPLIYGLVGGGEWLETWPSI